MATNAPTIAGRMVRRVHSARSETDALFALLDDAALYERPIPERHRLIFYLGHVEAFDWNQVCRGALGMPSFHPEFDKLFEFGIDPAPGTAAQDQPSDWPSVAEVRHYGAEVRRRVDRVLADPPEQIVHVVLEHRLMHAETLTYLLQERRSKGIIEDAAASHLESPLLEVPKGLATLGQRRGEFGWDNEFVEHTVEVPAFAISKYKVTNGEYARFIDEGGPVPHCWPRHLDWPVYCTHDQALAYAAWAGKSLPTEAQFHRAAYGTPEGVERLFPWGNDSPASSRGNFASDRWDPLPVDAHPAGDSAWGVSQLVGNGWEWTATEFAPFAGFEPFPFYAGYSANFFDGQHFVMKGAGVRTPPEFLRRSFRNWFRRDYLYVPASFRLVEAA
jgi:gamma-glutamyl hercynylcysteine S-oxide synthase